MLEYLRKRDVIFYQFFRDLSKKEQQIFWDDLGVENCSTRKILKCESVTYDLRFGKCFCLLLFFSLGDVIIRVWNKTCRRFWTILHVFCRSTFHRHHWKTRWCKVRDLIMIYERLFIKSYINIVISLGPQHLIISYHSFHTWNSKQQFFNDNHFWNKQFGIIQLKQALKNGCLRFQVYNTCRCIYNMFTWHDRF